MNNKVLFASLLLALIMLGQAHAMSSMMLYQEEDNTIDVVTEDILATRFAFSIMRGLITGWYHGMYK
jgi:hypothetical protein